MLPSPSSSPVRPTFIDRTNALQGQTPVRSDTSFSLPTPPEHGKTKRPGPVPESPSRTRKRPRFSFATVVNRGEDDASSVSGDVFVDDVDVARARARKRTVFAMRGAAAAGRSWHSSWNASFPTSCILQTFVSSHKSDVFKCYSDHDNFLTQPYACAFSHRAKRGESSHLAVATEQGSVYIFDTAKRRDWDAEAPRITLHPHANGVFDVRWSPADALLATCSGDHTVRISDPQREDMAPLHELSGAGATVKCVAWRAGGESVLAAGGRNGKILVWDLRVSGGGEPVLTFGLDKAKGDLPKAKARKAKLGAAPSRSATSVLFTEDDSYGLTSSSSHDGILRRWDFRLPSGQSTRTPAPLVIQSPLDPTTQHGSLRPRGLTSLVAGHGPSAGLLFALGADARVHTYAQPTLHPLAPHSALSHPALCAPSFYVRAALSPCGRWLATGGSGANAAAFTFDVAGVAANAARGNAGAGVRGVQLRGQTGEVGAVDWAQGTLATCADDGTVRVWRPDVEAYRRCQKSPEEATWDYAWAI